MCIYHTFFLGNCENCIVGSDHVYVGMAKILMNSTCFLPGAIKVFTDVHVSDTKTGRQTSDTLHTRSGCQIFRIFTCTKR